MAENLNKKLEGGILQMALYHFTLKSDRKPDGTKIMAHEHAEYNEREGKYERLDEKRNSVASSDHIDYINRDASFAVKEGCLYKGHHLPAWANGSTKTFFMAADIYEESEHTYKEIEFALQNELTLEQNLEVINDFIAKNFSDYYYAYAVHDKVAALGNGERNLHCHLMFSPRQLDELEKQQERAPECFFKKARRIYTKSDGTPIDNRREGGCKIPPYWIGRLKTRLTAKPKSGNPLGAEISFRREGSSRTSLIEKVWLFSRSVRSQLQEYTSSPGLI